MVCMASLGPTLGPPLWLGPCVAAARAIGLPSYPGLAWLGWAWLGLAGLAWLGFGFWLDFDFGLILIFDFELILMWILI